MVEPAEELAETICKYLTSDFDVDACNTTQKAVSSADKNKPSIVVMELALPDNNGVAFLHEFRSYVDWINVPVIIYSHVPKEDTGLTEAGWRKQGVSAYLYKPTTSLASLKNTINQILNIYETN